MVFTPTSSRHFVSHKKTASPSYSFFHLFFIPPPIHLREHFRAPPTLHLPSLGSPGYLQFFFFFFFLPHKLILAAAQIPLVSGFSPPVLVRPALPRQASLGRLGLFFPLPPRNSFIFFPIDCPPIPPSSRVPFFYADPCSPLVVPLL